MSGTLLIGNTFPLTLVRGWRVEIEEVEAETLREALVSGAAAPSAITGWHVLRLRWVKRI